MSHEQRFPSHQPFSNREDLVHEPAVWVAAIAHLGLEINVVLHVIHCAGFRDHRFLRIQLNLYDLHVIAEQFKIYVMRIHNNSP